MKLMNLMNLMNSMNIRLLNSQEENYPTTMLSNESNTSSVFVPLFTISSKIVITPFCTIAAICWSLPWVVMLMNTQLISLRSSSLIGEERNVMM